MPSTLLQLLAYFGVMAVTFIVPVVSPSFPTLYFANIARFAQPWAIALSASAATATAASVDYHLVRRVFRVGALERARNHRLFVMFERWAKVAPFLTIMIFAGFPLPFFIPRVLIPLSGYPAWRYVMAAALGRYPRIYVIASFGRALEIPNNILLAMLAASVVIGVFAALVRRSRSRRAVDEPEVAPKPPEDKAA